jgi:hypothetical protein
MIEEKRQIILSEGVPVELRKADGTTTDVTALIGRANRTANSSTLTLEAHRRAHFLPDVPVQSGDTVLHTLIGERYIVIADMDEVIDGQLAAHVVHMVICNTKVTISGITETVTPRGDIKKVDIVKAANLDAYTQAMSADLLQQNPGLFSDVEYVIYAPGIDITVLDKVSLSVGARQIPLKVTNVDYLSYPGLALIQVCSETRK